MKLQHIIACLVLGIFSVSMAASPADYWVHSLATAQGIGMDTVDKDLKTCAAVDTCGFDEDTIDTCLGNMAGDLCPECSDQEREWLVAVGWFNVLDERECGKSCDNIICSGSVAWWFCEAEPVCMWFLSEGEDYRRRSFAGRQNNGPPDTNPPHKHGPARRNMRKSSYRSNLFASLRSKLAKLEK